MSSGQGGGNDQSQGTKPSSGATRPTDSGDPIDELVDWQMSNPPLEDGWTCPDCGMNWTSPPNPCPCGDPNRGYPNEVGQPNAAVLELAFWEALKRCALDEQSPITLSPCGEGERGGISFGRRIPDELWQHMAAALADLRAATGVGTDDRE